VTLADAVDQQAVAELERELASKAIKAATSGTLLSELRRRGYEFTFTKELKTPTSDYQGRLMPTPEGEPHPDAARDVWQPGRAPHGPRTRGKR
jgi:hypothetical protein